MKSTLNNIKVLKLWHGGIGIALHEDGRKILIKGWVLPWSVVDLNIVKRRKDHLEAHVIQTKSYDSQYADGEVFCPHFFIPTGISAQHAGTEKIGCGGCKWQLMSYEKQLQIKQQLVEESFGKITAKKEKKIRFLPIIGSPLTRGYRNKIEFSFGVYISEKEQLRAPRCCGFHKQGEFSKIVDVDSCWLISEKANQVFYLLKQTCFNSGLPTYDQKTHQGFFRHLVIREGVNTGELLVNLSVAEHTLTPEQKTLRERLQHTFSTNPLLREQITSFVITANASLADTVRNEQSKSRILRGKGSIEEMLNGVRFRVSPFSFFQTNTHGAEKLFLTAFTMLGDFEGNILDLYCGTGSIGLSLLSLSQKTSSPKKESGVIGIEIVEDAIRDANINAELNGLSAFSSFYASPAEKALERFPELAGKIKNLWVVVIDPPRDGLHKNVIEWISNLKKEHHFKLLYISCNSVTMARDVELFLEHGFDLKEIQPLDLFPYTHHCECIWVLS